MDIYFYEAFDEETKALKKYLDPSIHAEFTWKTIQEAGDETPPAPVISIRTQSQIPLQWAGKLSGILSRSTGYDHIAAYLKECGKDIPSGYLPTYCSRSVAEQAMLLWMSLLRKLPRQMKQFNTFHRDGITGTECEGKTLLVVGVGNIGIEVVRIGQGLGMDVLGVDIVERHERIAYVSIEEGLARADIIVCAMNLTSENRGYFNYDTLKKAKRGVVFVNISRGEFSPAQDLLRLTQEGHAGGIGLDVYNRETELADALRAERKSDDPEVNAVLALEKHSHVILTPHNAFNTLEAVDRKASQSIEQITHFVEKGGFIWPIPTN